MSERAVESLEIERKYEVPAGAELPSADALAAIGLAPDQVETVELHAVYYDTAERDLAKNRIAVRVRHGGADAGWHLKLKNDQGAHEMLWPAASEMPLRLRQEIETRVGITEGIAPIAELRTVRNITRLRDVHGAEMIELVDDYVRALDHADGAKRAWREWEAELAQGADIVWLAALEPVLEKAGADRSPSPAKIARATGSLVPLALRAGAPEEKVERLRAMEAADLAAGLG